MRVLLLFAAVALISGCGNPAEKPKPLTTELIVESIRAGQSSRGVVKVNGEHLPPDKVEFDDKLRAWNRYAATNGYVWVSAEDEAKGGDLIPSTIQFSQSGKRE